MHYAVQSGNCDVLQWLICDLGLDSHTPDSFGRSATHIAASMGSVHMLQNLHLNKRLSFDPDENGSTPLHLAARHGSVDCVQVLLAAGHPSVATDSLGCSPLHVACMERSMGAINVLAQVGNIDEYDSSGASPLMICVGKGMQEAMETLLKYGARATHRDYTGRSCLHAVLSLPHDDSKQLSLQRSIAALLIKHSSDVNARDTLGRSPCHIASEKGNIQMLKFFIDSGADVSVTDSSGKTCLTQLSRENFNEVTQILIDRIIPLSHQQVRASLESCNCPPSPSIILTLATSAIFARQTCRWATSVCRILGAQCDCDLCSVSGDNGDSVFCTAMMLCFPVIARLTPRHTPCMYVHEKLELTVPAEITLHFEMLKVHPICRDFRRTKFRYMEDTNQSF